jgi:hypothetical protein
MRKVARNVARALLWIVTGMLPFVIAACYGAMYSFSRNGRVIDRRTRAGINGIQVNCNVGGMVDSQTTSYSDGSFYVDSYRQCETLTFEDVDGAANGTYLLRTIPMPATDPMVVELDPGP